MGIEELLQRLRLLSERIRGNICCGASLNATKTLEEVLEITVKLEAIRRNLIKQGIELSDN